MKSYIFKRTKIYGYLFFLIIYSTSLFSQSSNLHFKDIVKPDIIERNISGFKSMQKRAHEGKMNAQYKFGMYYVDRNSADFNIRRATYWFQESAKQGYAKAYYELGNLYSYKQEYQIAYDFYSSASLKGNTDSAFRKAVILEKGLGFNKNYKKSKKILDSLVVNANMKEAAFNLAEYYLKGWESEIDTVKAIKLLLKAQPSYTFNDKEYKNKLVKTCRLLRLNDFYFFNKNYNESKSNMIKDGISEKEINSYIKYRAHVDNCYKNKIKGWQDLVCEVANGMQSKGYFNYSKFKKTCQDCFKNSDNLLKYKTLLGRYSKFILNTDNDSSESERNQVIGWMEENLDNDPEKNYLLGKKLLYGTKTLEKDIYKAYKYLKLAYKKNYVQANRDYATVVLTIGVDTEIKTALKILENQKAYLTLALNYVEGNSLPQDFEKAKYYALKGLEWVDTKYVRKRDKSKFELSLSDHLYLALNICEISKTCDSELHDKLEASLEHEMQCKVCYGKGEVECSACNGKGQEYYDTGHLMNTSCRTCKGSGILYCEKTINEPSSNLVKYFNSIVKD